MARKRGRKSKNNRRNILLISLGIIFIIGIGFYTTEPARKSVVQLFGQETQHLIFSPTPQDLIGDFGESLSTLCKFRGILYYVTDTGERIQGSLSFGSLSPPFEAGSVVSPFTGKTITSFEIDVHLSCKQREGFDSRVQAVGGQFRNTVGATDSDGKEKLILETFNTISGVSKANPIRIPDSDDFPGTKLTTIKVPAIEIEKKLDDDPLSFSSTVRFIQSYSVTLLIDDTFEEFSGSLENRYKVDIVNNKGSATPLEPSNKNLELRIIDPPSKVLVSGNIFTFEILMWDWDQSEGFPSITIQDFTNKIIFTKDIPLSGSNRDVSIFADRFQFPGKTVGEYTISASVPAFREVATDYISVVSTNDQVPKEPESPKPNEQGIIECLQGFTQSGSKCIQNAQNVFIDPTELANILGVVVGSLAPIVIGVVVLIIIILIISSLIKGSKRRGGSGGRGFSINLSRGGGGNGSSQSPPSNGDVLPRGFGKQRSAV